MVCATSSHILKFIFIGFYFVFAFFSISTTGTKHSTHCSAVAVEECELFFRSTALFFSLLLKSVSAFLFHFVYVEKWSQHIDLTELNRHILCSMHEERITMKKEKIQQHRTNWKRSAKKKCKSFVKWPKLGKLFTHNIRLLEWL